MAGREGVSPAAVAKIAARKDIITNSDALRWLQSPIPTDRLAAWVALPAALDLLTPWATDPNREFGPKKSMLLLRAGFLHPDEYRHWRDENRKDPAAAMSAAWDNDPPPTGGTGCSHGWDDPTVTRLGGLWHPDLYRDWRAVADDGLFDAHQSVAPMRAGISPSDFARWVTATAGPYERTSRLLGVGFRYGHAAVAWQQRFGNLTVTQARVDAWNRSWSRQPPALIATWLADDVTPTEAERWSKALAATAFGVDEDDEGPFTVNGGPFWRSQGFRPSDRPWFTATRDAYRRLAEADDHFSEDFVVIAGLLHRRGLEPDSAAIAAVVAGGPAN